LHRPAAATLLRARDGASAAPSRRRPADAAAPANLNDLVAGAFVDSASTVVLLLAALVSPHGRMLQETSEPDQALDDLSRAAGRRDDVRTAPLAHPLLASSLLEGRLADAASPASPAKTS
jgi:hypothetical protein